MTNLFDEGGWEVPNQEIN
jgi:UBA/TS-N domain